MTQTNDGGPASEMTVLQYYAASTSCRYLYFDDVRDWLGLPKDTPLKKGIPWDIKDKSAVPKSVEEHMDDMTADDRRRMIAELQLKNADAKIAAEQEQAK